METEIFNSRYFVCVYIRIWNKHWELLLMLFWCSNNGRPWLWDLDSHSVTLSLWSWHDHQLTFCSVMTWFFTFSSWKQRAQVRHDTRHGNSHDSQGGDYWDPYSHQFGNLCRFAIGMDYNVFTTSPMGIMSLRVGNSHNSHHPLSLLILTLETG